MEIEAKVPSQVRVSIPVMIRRALGIDVGDRVVFAVDNHGVPLRARHASTGFAEYERSWREGGGKTTDKIKAEIRSLRGTDE